MHNEKWLDWRAKGIGASDAAAIMNVAPREWQVNTPYKLWQQKLGLLKVNETMAMSRGKAYEDDALSWFQDKVGKHLFSQAMFECEELPWMRATFDGIDIEEEVSVEIKIGKKEYFDEVQSGKVPFVYVPQLQHQMKVKPVKHHFLCMYLPEYKEGAYVEVKPNENYVAELLEKEKEVWECIQMGIPPALTEKDFIDRSNDVNWLRQAQRLSSLQEQLKDLKKQEEEAKSALIQISQGESCVGGDFKLTRYFVKGTVEYKKIPELQHVDLEMYRKNPTEAFRFT